MERLIFQTLKKNNNLHVSMYHKRFIFAKLILKNNEILKTLILVPCVKYVYIYIYMKRKVDFLTKQDIARYQ